MMLSCLMLSVVPTSRGGVTPQAPGSDPVCFIPAVDFQQAAPQEANLEALSSGFGDSERDFKGPLGPWLSRGWTPALYIPSIS